MANCALSALPGPLINEYVNVSAESGSLVLRVPIGVPTGWFSAMDWLSNWTAVGVR